MSKYDLIVVGDLLTDILLPVDKLPLQPDELAWSDGLFTELGGGGTTLVAARRLGLAVAALDVLGNDDYGRRILRMLADEGVDVGYALQKDDRKTLACLVITDKMGQHLFVNFHNDTPPQRCPDAWRAATEQARCLFTTGYTLRYFLHAGDVLMLLRHGRERGATIFFDPGPTIADLDADTVGAALAVTDVLLLTVDEARHLVQAEDAEAAEALRRFGPSVVVLKTGPTGCIVSTPNGVFHQPGFAVEVVDTVGAGDAFAAAFIAGYVRGADWQTCAALGNAMGAAVVGTQGAGRRVPTAERVAEILGADPINMTR